jgi:NifB/MoaA-like Fe-S oxidoreductase
MTSQEKIEFLGRYKTISRRIDQLLDERAEWRARATKITPTLSDMPKGGEQPNKIQMAVEKMTEIEKEVDIEIDAAQTTKSEIMAAIKAVSDETLRNVLELRYISGKKWEQIAVETNYDYRYVLKLHGRALQMVELDTKRH